MFRKQEEMGAKKSFLSAAADDSRCQQYTEYSVQIEEYLGSQMQPMSSILSQSPLLHGDYCVVDNFPRLHLPAAHNPRGFPSPTSNSFIDLLVVTGPMDFDGDLIYRAGLGILADGK